MITPDMLTAGLMSYLIPVLLAVGLVALSLKIVAEYERLVVLFLGRFQAVKQPGLRIVVPGIQRLFRVDLRVITMDIPPQDVISHDNVTVRVNAVLYFRVVDPEKAIIQVEDFNTAINQLAQTTLRSVLGQHDLDEMLADREKLNDNIQQIIDKDLSEGKHNMVATRFPPEPNGYLHIGHAKSICLNFGIARDYQGTCNLRFDDTNPLKESEDFAQAIMNDVRWLGFEWDELRHASDYFQQLYEYALHLIRTGTAYVEELDADEIRAYRGTLTEPGRESPWRDRPADVPGGRSRGSIGDESLVSRTGSENVQACGYVRDCRSNLPRAGLLCQMPDGVGDDHPLALAAGHRSDGL